MCAAITTIDQEIMVDATTSDDYYRSSSSRGREEGYDILRDFRGRNGDYDRYRGRINDDTGSNDGEYGPVVSNNREHRLGGAGLGGAGLDGSSISSPGFGGVGPFGASLSG